MMKKTAVLFGATGLTGSHVLQRLAGDDRYEKVIVFSRSEPEIKNDKIEVIITRLEDLDRHENKIKGDDVFCCLGTTIKKAGSKEQFRKVDLEFPEKIASIASKNKVNNFLVISSIGADPWSSNFYLRTKGEMEKSVLRFDLKNTFILRPSMLMGKRRETRYIEEAAKFIMFPMNFVLQGRLKKYRAIYAETVAKAMIELANSGKTGTIYESDEIEKTGQ